MGFDEALGLSIWSDEMTTSETSTMPSQETFNATEFKAKCLDILDRLAERQLTRVVITKRGRVVAVLSPPDDEAVAIRSLHGCMQGSVMLPAGVDLSLPVLDEPILADKGVLHA
ncbi:MAG: type II toxin-antitoxin system Phd/YefM family antitoxin [Acetobacteraceae bacterium]|nr:type II toxin-antitoxin system Phd/YefM family antitoxin [Acetobacteraceae bacterium]